MEENKSPPVDAVMSLSPPSFPLHFQFSLIFFSLQGEAEGGLIAQELGVVGVQWWLWTLQRFSTYQSFT